MADPYVTDTYLKISRRLRSFDPPLDISTFIKKGGSLKPSLGSDVCDGSLCAGRSTLEGITFIPTDHQTLLKVLHNAKNSYGDAVFVDASTEDNLALHISMAATHGVGLREIHLLRLSDRPLSYDNGNPNHQGWRQRYTQKFAPSTADMSSLHCAVAKDVCNIHIDEMGFVVMGPDGQVFLDADFLQHTVNELLLKTEFDGKLPDWLIDRLNIEIPNSTNGYSRVGISYDISRGKRYVVRGSLSCSILGDSDCSGELTVGGKF